MVQMKFITLVLVFHGIIGYTRDGIKVGLKSLAGQSLLASAIFTLAVFHLIKKEYSTYVSMFVLSRAKKHVFRVVSLHILCIYTKIVFARSWTVSGLFRPKEVKKSIKPRIFVIYEFHCCPKTTLSLFVQAGQKIISEHVGVCSF